MKQATSKGLEGSLTQQSSQLRKWADVPSISFRFFFQQSEPRPALVRLAVFWYRGSGAAVSAACCGLGVTACSQVGAALGWLLGPLVLLIGRY